MRAALIVLLGATLGAYSPPPLRGHVVDTTASLSADEVRDLDLTIDAMGNGGGFALVVLVTDLAGTPIEDVAYTAFNTWAIGEKGKDNGVLLVIAPKDRRVRIETGKGIGGALPDLKTNDIIRTSIEPALRDGHLKVAIEDGAIAIATALNADPSWSRSETVPTGRATADTGSSPWTIVGGVLLVIVAALGMFGRRRGIATGGTGWWGGGLGGGGLGGGGGGGSAGSGYTGGGGHSGGGGSNDSY